MDKEKFENEYHDILEQKKCLEYDEPDNCFVCGQEHGEEDTI